MDIEEEIKTESTTEFEVVPSSTHNKESTITTFEITNTIQTTSTEYRTITVELENITTWSLRTLPIHIRITCEKDGSPVHIPIDIVERETTRRITHAILYNPRMLLPNTMEVVEDNHYVLKNLWKKNAFTFHMVPNMTVTMTCYVYFYTILLIF